MNIALGATACALYLLATARLGCLIPQHSGADQQHNNIKSVKFQAFAIGILALICNIILLNNVIFLNVGLDMGFSNAWALISWFIAAMILIIAFSKPIENLLVIFFPLAALGVLLVLFFPSQRIVSESVAIGIKVHILLCILAYSLFTVATCQSILLAFQEYQLRRKQPIMTMRLLPPMQVMEDLLIKIIVVGFFTLSLGLTTGLMFVHDIFGQHLIHKTILSIISWLVFAILLWGRWYLGWRGQTISCWTISGFMLLMLAFFGSKFVLEIILMRV